MGRRGLVSVVVSEPHVTLRSGNNCWATPRDIVAYAASVVRADFALDLAAEAPTAVAPTWYGPGSPFQADALAAEDWEAPGGGPRWVNPPYGRQCAVCAGFVWSQPDPKRRRPGCKALGHPMRTIAHWMERASLEGTRPGCAPLVCCVPYRTDRWWTRFVDGLEAGDGRRLTLAPHARRASLVERIDGRLQYLELVDGELQPRRNATFSAALVYYLGPRRQTPNFRVISS